MSAAWEGCRVVSNCDLWAPPRLGAPADRDPSFWKGGGAVNRSHPGVKVAEALDKVTALWEQENKWQTEKASKAVCMGVVPARSQLPGSCLGDN